MRHGPFICIARLAAPAFGGASAPKPVSKKAAPFAATDLAGNSTTTNYNLLIDAVTYYGGRDFESVNLPWQRDQVFDGDQSEDVAGYPAVESHYHAPPWPSDLTPGIETDTYGDGTVETYDYNVHGSWPLLGRDMGSFNAAAALTGGLARERVKPKYHLLTGGKSGSLRQNLFQLTCDVGAYDPVPYFMNPFWPQHAVPNQKIVLGAVGSLGSDGKLWKALADDREFDVTPYIAGENFYFFAPGQQKYQLVIGASSATTGAWLDPDVVVPGAQFCVGQSVSFGAGFQPTLSEAPEIDPLRWGFGGTYVNDHTNAGPNCSENYFLNSAKLSNPSQHNWWVGWTGDDTVKQYNAIIAEGLTFANGQNVVVDARGEFNMQRPQVILSSGKGLIAVDTNYNSSGTWLHYGNPKYVPGFTAIFITSSNDWSLGI